MTEDLIKEVETLKFKNKELKKTIDGKEKEIASLKQAVQTHKLQIMAMEKVQKEMLQPVIDRVAQDFADKLDVKDQVAQ